MNELARHGLLVVAVLALTFAGPVAAYVFLMWRKRAARAVRRSPLTKDLLRAPGQALREQLDELAGDSIGDLAILMVIPAMAAAFVAVNAVWQGRQPSVIVIGGSGLVVVVFVAITIVRMARRSAVMDRLRLGSDAELAAGQELDQLMRRGAAVFHDVPGEGFNIDHVVVAPQGVFAVETKGYAKRGDLPGRDAARVEYDGQRLSFPGYRTSEPLEQAARQSQWLSRMLSKATGDAIDTTPVLALPGWFVERKGNGAVRVYSGAELGKLLDARGSGVRGLGDGVFQRVVYQLEQRCRNVKPNYRE